MFFDWYRLLRDKISCDSNGHRAVVVFNNSFQLRPCAGCVSMLCVVFILRLNPAGDLLALAAALCWAVYSVLIKFVSGRYSAVFITRKVFFYGILTIMPVFAVHPWSFPWRAFSQPVVWGNLLFLGILASFVCFAVWSYIIKQLGAIRTSNYVYLNPISTVIISALFLDEPMTPVAFAGSALILAGVYIANKKGN